MGLSLPCIIFIISLIIDPILPWTDFVIAVYTILVIFWSLLFIIPAVYIIYATNPKKDRKYSKNVLRFQTIAGSSTLIGMGLFYLIGFQISQPSVTIRDFFFAYFWISIPIGFILGLSLLVLGWIAYKLRIWHFY